MLDCLLPFRCSLTDDREIFPSLSIRSQPLTVGPQSVVRNRNGMPKTPRIEWIVICTASFDQSVDFFRNILGLKLNQTGTAVVDTQFDRFAQFETENGIVVEVVEPKNEQIALLYNQPIISFTVQVLEDAIESARLGGAKLITGIFKTDGGVGWIYLRDRDGYIFQLQGPVKRSN